MNTTRASSLSGHEVLFHLRADARTGLNAEEIEARQGLVPPNELEHEDEDPMYKKYIEQFKDPLILLLLASAALSLLIKQYDDAVSIFMAVTIVATVAFVQEYRSEQSLKALTQLLPPHALCLRDGHATDLLARDLIPGDIVLLKSGDRIPADCRILECSGLCVDESSLTGESDPHHKNAALLNRSRGHGLLDDSGLAQCEGNGGGGVGSSEKLIDGNGPLAADDDDDARSGDSPLAECSNMVFMGTLACGGHGKAVVTSTGMKTEFGKTFEEMRDVDSRRTPLQMKMDDLGKQLSLVSFVVIGVIAAVGVLQGKRLLEMFNIGVSLAVAAIPEGLPICVTVTLALGVMRMAKRNAIVKRLPAVEALGCATVVCVDKTGTLTQNQMTVREVFVLPEEQPVEVSGVGYQTDGEFRQGKEILDCSTSPALRRMLEAGCMCNNAMLGEVKGGTRQDTRQDAKQDNDQDNDQDNGHTPGGNVLGAVSQDANRGQPTELALLVAAAKFGVKDPRSSQERVHEVAFSSERKCMEVHCRQGSRITYYLKGSVEAVLPHCTAFTSKEGDREEVLDDLGRHRVVETATLLGAKGRRVLAIAFGAQRNGLIFGGLFGIMDPPRLSAGKSVKDMQASGTRVCMITGDAEETAVAVATSLGFFDPSLHHTLSGQEIEAMGTIELEAMIQDVAVFHRTSPRHKLSIVRALQGIGEVVAMTGDGVNDAPALKAADIGVAMGLSGTDVAKEAADMILMDDNFSTIVATIEEGKAIFYNIKNFLTFQLSTSVAALSIVAVATFLGFKCPLNAMQILWINIIMDGPPAQSLGVEPVHGAVLARPPRKAQDPIITRQLMFRILTSGLLIVLGTLWVFSKEMLEDGTTSRATAPTRRDTTMTFTTFVMFDMFNALCCRSGDKTVLEMNIFANRAFIFSVGASLLGQMLVVYFSPLQEVFQTEALPLHDLLLIVGTASSMMFLDTARKILRPEVPSTKQGWHHGALIGGMKNSLGRGDKLSMA